MYTTFLPVLQPKNRLCITLDGFDLFSDHLEDDVRTRLNTVCPYIGSVRCKYELFYSAHFDLISLLKVVYGLDILMDLNLKYMGEDKVKVLSYDLSVRGVDIFNISIDTPQNIINAIIKGAERYSKEFNKPKPKILGIIPNNNKKDILELVINNLDGVVCSAIYLEFFKLELPKESIFVTTTDEVDDDYDELSFALRAGSDLLIVGKSVYKYEMANDQLKEIRKISDLIEKSLKIN